MIISREERSLTKEEWGTKSRNSVGKGQNSIVPYFDNIALIGNGPEANIGGRDSQSNFDPNFKFVRERKDFVSDLTREEWLEKCQDKMDVFPYGEIITVNGITFRYEIGMEHAEDVLRKIEERDSVRFFDIVDKVENPKEFQVEG